MNKYQKKTQQRLRKISASIMLFLIIGAFLLPQLAYAKIINNENIINLTNQTRIKQGLTKLNANQLLSKAAYDKAEAIFAEQSFKHNLQGKKFSTWIKNTGYQYQSVGENLAIDFISSEGAMKAWLESPSHKRNILNPKFKEIGVAVKSNIFEGRESILIVQIFGTPINQTSEQKNNINNYQENNINQKTNIKKPVEHTEMLLTNSAPQTLLVTNINSKIKSYNNPDYLDEAHSFYGQKYLSMELVEQTILCIIDYSHTYLINYYWTIIIMLLAIFSSSFIWHKKRYIKN